MDFGDIGRTVMRAMQQGRVGFSVQQVNAVDEHSDVLYSECLARLVELDGSVITAGEFMLPLEAFGYAPHLDRHIVNLAFDWLSSNPCGSLGWNISTGNFSSREHWALLYDELYRHRSLAPRLVLEVTESAPMALLSGVAALIQDVRKLGYRVAVDDFGTGFSTPEALFSMDVDLVKIDAFFARLNTGRDAHRLLHHMVGLVSCAAPTVVVEGIETYDQLALAKAVGATHVQGYLLSEPSLAPIYLGPATTVVTSRLM